MSDADVAVEKIDCGETVWLKRPFVVSMKDGALLHGHRWQREKPVRPGGRGRKPMETPLLLLPDELANSREYDGFIRSVGALPHAPTTIITIDMRGRGLSSQAPVADTDVTHDAQDLVSLYDALGLHHMNMVVSGRGAFPVFLAALQRPGNLAALVLNDAGPEMDNVGIARESTLLKRMSTPQSWNDVADQFRTLHREDPVKDETVDFDAVARVYFREEGGKPVPDHHKNLVRLSNTINYDDRPMALWQEFALLKNVPTLLVRGQKSPLLTGDIEARMGEAHNALDVHTVPNQGHVPDIAGNELPETIMDFLATNTK